MIDRNATKPRIIENKRNGEAEKNELRGFVELQRAEAFQMLIYQHCCSGACGDFYEPSQ